MAETPDTTTAPTPPLAPPVAEPYPNIFFVEGKALGHEPTAMPTRPSAARGKLPATTRD